MSRTTRLGSGLSAVAVIALLAGCSGGADAPADDGSSVEATEPSAEETTLEPAAADVDDMSLLPDSYAEAGVLKGAITDGMAPWSFLDEDTRDVSGVDADLMNEAASRLGMTIEWDDIQFPAALPGVQGGRYDFYVSAMADRPDRQEVVNFIDYSYEGSGVIVPEGNPLGIDSFDDLCGLQVNYLTGSLFPDFVDALNADTCQDEPIRANESPDKPATYLAVASGQADATFDTYGVSNYTFETVQTGENLDLELAPVAPFAPARQGIAFAKGNIDLQLAIAGAMQEMLEDGTYREILDAWSVGDLIVEDVLVNSALDAEVTDLLER